MVGIIDLCDSDDNEEDDFVSVVENESYDAIDSEEILHATEYNNNIDDEPNTQLNENSNISIGLGIAVTKEVMASQQTDEGASARESIVSGKKKATVGTKSKSIPMSQNSNTSTSKQSSSSFQYKSHYPHANNFRRKPGAGGVGGGTTNSSSSSQTASNIARAPRTNNAFREVGLVVEGSVINRQYAKKLLECFTVQAANMSLLVDPESAATNKKTRTQNETILREVEQNQLRALTDHSLFRLYADKRLTMPGLCLWTHRQIELGGNCGLGAPYSTVFPFAVVLYSSQRFANLVFSSLLDRSGAATSSSSGNGVGSRVEAIFEEEFSLLHDEIVCLRQRLQETLGEHSGRCRLTLVLTALDIHLVAKVKEVVSVFMDLTLHSSHFYLYYDNSPIVCLRQHIIVSMRKERVGACLKWSRTRWCTWPKSTA